eukprot:scaffold627_cov144-Skeletonema_menzelii.AAC.22
MESRSVILVIDAGSSSVRCTSYELLDSSEVLSTRTQPPIKAIEGMSYSVPMMSVTPNTGYIRIHEVIDAIDLCIDEVLRLLRETISDEYNITALGFSTFVMNLVGVDEFGEPLGDEATMSYACNRAEVLDTCSRIERALTPDMKQSIYKQTGAPLHPAYALPQLIAFYETKDSDNAHLVEKVHQWKSISSICLSRWTGQRHTQIPISYSEASWTGLLNFGSCTWNDEVLSILEKSCNLKLLPPLSDFDMVDDLRKGISQQSHDGSNNIYWNRWPELRQCQFFLGIGDGAAANVGSKCGLLSSGDDNKRRIAVTIGTSAAARLCLPLEIGTLNHSVVVPFGLFCYRVDKSTLLLGGALTDGGSIIEWARSLFNLHSTESFNVCLQKVAKIYSGRCDSPSPGVTMAPFLSGERSTGFRVGANGCISGITRETTSIDIVYACLESVVLRLCAIIKLLTSVCEENKSQYILVASGNALEKNHLWRQMLADCCAIDIVIDSDSNEGTSRGVALLVAKTLCNDCSKESLVIENESVPDHKASNYWKTASVAQESLISAVSSTWGGT